jgi:hypothetical protein
MKTEIKDEEWRKIPGLPNYEASSLARIRSSYKGGNKIMSQYINTRGYFCTGITHQGKTKTKLVHRLVAMAFHGLPGAGMTAHHKDFNSQNNVPDNLMWCTNEENIGFSIAAGHMKGEFGGKRFDIKEAQEITKKPVTCYDSQTMTTTTYKSITECADSLKVTQPCVSHAIRRGGKIGKRYEVTLAIDKATLKA